MKNLNVFCLYFPCSWIGIFIILQLKLKRVFPNVLASDRVLLHWLGRQVQDLQGRA